MVGPDQGNKATRGRRPPPAGTTAAAGGADTTAKRRRSRTRWGPRRARVSGGGRGAAWGIVAAAAMATGEDLRRRVMAGTTAAWELLAGVVELRLSPPCCSPHSSFSRARRRLRR
ncbi:hypothetical protein ACP4OV_014699 [Aristida adscensionis]